MGENLEVIREDLWDEAKGSEKVKVTITGEHTRPGNSGEKESHTERYQTYQLERGKRIIAEAEYRVRMNGMEMSKALIRLDIRCLDAH